MEELSTNLYYSSLAERVYRVQHGAGIFRSRSDSNYENLRALLADRVPDEPEREQLATVFASHPELAAEVAELLDAADLDRLARAQPSAADGPFIAELAEYVLIALETQKKTQDKLKIVKVLRSFQIELPSIETPEYKLDPKQFRWWLRRDLREGLTAHPEAAEIWRQLDWPRPFSLVLKEELDEISKSRAARGVVAQGAGEISGDPVEKALQMNLIGLAFSGGGIRSATFNLGILQGLARRGLLRSIDYLSTVSGGGYIGSWLVSWIKSLPGSKQLQQIQPLLSPKDSPEPNTPGLQPIQFLRKYSNYLTPKLGALSADAWTMGAIWLRNTLLNFIILVAGFLALLIVPRALAFLYSRWVGPFDLTTTGRPLAIGLLALLGVATFVIGLNLRDITEGKSDARTAQRSVITIFVILPVVFSALLLSRWLHAPELFAAERPLLQRLLLTAPWFFVLFMVVQVVSDFAGCYNRTHAKSTWRIPGLWAAMLLIPAGSAAAAAFMVLGLAKMFQAWNVWPSGQFLSVTVGPPLVILLFSAAVTLQIGLMGPELPDAAREWLSRLGASLLIYSAIWIAFFGASIYGPYLLAALGAWSTWGHVAAAAAWLGTTITGVLKGKSAATGAETGGDKGFSPMDVVTGAAPYVFIGGFVFMIAVAVHMLVSPAPARPASKPAQKGTAIEISTSVGSVTVNLPDSKVPRAAPNVLDNISVWFGRVKEEYWISLRDAELWKGQYTPWWRALGIVFLASALLTLVLSWRVDVNEFSLHHFYKNRLVRAYLGATRGERKPSPFTGFDEKDDHPLKDFLPGAGYFGPYPLVNATLNLTRGNELAWQERKAGSFVFAPSYCGFDLGRPRANGHDSDLWPSAYRPTKTYAYPDCGIHLGTAVAISGAAASPNMGFHTSASLAFLMTVFDVRLGWWLGNSRRNNKARKSSPELGLIYLVKELLGLTDDRSGFVYVSDGGHFENLGIYELVRRRCRYIIACDAEQDGNLKFGGLAGAIRKCRTDFGVEIDIKLHRLEKVDGLSHAHCVVGTIGYPEPEPPGILVYIKATLTGDEPSDVAEYHSRQPAFPHQSTGDQWFDESQFESYRRLGLHIADSVFGSVRTELAENPKVFFQELQEICCPPSTSSAPTPGPPTDTVN